MHCTREEYLELHEDPARDNAIAEAMLYCNACGKRFFPTELTAQKDDWCVCKSCGDEIAEMVAGRIA